MQADRERSRRWLPGKALGLSLLGLFVLLSAIAWRAASHSAAADKANSSLPAPSTPLELAPADVATVATSELSRALPFTGTLSPLVQTTIKAKVAGEVLEVNVREGQAVRRGDVLARIDTRNLKAQLDSQQAALDKARADLALAKLNRDNSEQILKEHYISQNAFDTAESTYQADLASERAAEAQLRLAQIAWGDALVRAPFDGIVATRTAQPGEKVNIDDTLLSLVDLSLMELQAPAPASEIPSVRVGQVGYFRVSGFGERRFQGRVERINPVAEQSSRSIMIYLSVPNADSALKGGMFAQGSLTLDKTAPTTAMPAAAVRQEAGLPYVYLLADGKLQRRAVSLGLRSDDQGMVEVLSGLRPGDVVVLASVDTLKDGQAALLKTGASAAGASVAAATHGG